MASTFLDAGPGSYRQRLGEIDTLRGLVMLLMVLDHCRDYFHASSFHPRDVAEPGLFLTRWVTHLCAPTFVLLAGISASLYGDRVQHLPALRRFLWTRGVWLIVLELTVVRLGWTFSGLSRALILQVIWALGVSMLILAGLVHLPRWAIGALGLGAILGHNALDGIHSEALGGAAWLWTLLHESTTLRVESGWTFWALYPLIPWVGVMAAGYALGPVLWLPEERRRKLLLRLGLALVGVFVVVRGSNRYGDPAPWSGRDTFGESLLAFLDCEKYPPSLLFLCMTLGPALILLAAWTGRMSRAAHWVATIGRVPLFFYLAHIYLLHALAVLASLLLLGHAAGLMGVFPPDKPPGFGFSLPVVYLIAALVIGLLMPACRRYALWKSRGRGWWWSYL